jgi:hypothetical protein
MQPLRIRKPRARKGTRRFTKAAKPVVRKRPVGAWAPRDAVYFETLRHYVRRERHARVPYEHREGNVALGLWVSLRRRDHRRERLTPEQIRILEALPGWTWQPVADHFPKGLAAIERFARREGHASVPRGHVENGVRLGLWASNRRADRKKGRLSRDQIRALDAVPGWTWSLRDSWFETGLAHLLRFVKREGHACVPVDHAEGAYALGAFVHHMRTRRARMNPARLRRLERLPGWAWNVFDAGFERGLRALRVYATREGHACSPAKHVEDGFRLGGWVSHLRSRRRELSRDRRRTLEAFPAWSWSLRK